VAGVANIGKIADVSKEVGKTGTRFADSPIGKKAAELSESPKESAGRFADSTIGRKAAEIGNQTGIRSPDEKNGGKNEPNNPILDGVIKYETANPNEQPENKGLTDEEKAKIKEETGWSDEIIDCIENMEQYEILKNAGLKEVEINGRKCLIRENIDLDYKDADGMTNRERMERGLPPLDSKTGKPLELHHLGQKKDSPLVELTQEEHRTGDFKDGKKNQSLWHDNSKSTEVHGEGNNWKNEREEHWKSRAEQN